VGLLSMYLRAPFRVISFKTVRNNFVFADFVFRLDF
jgi:hypothetical protein